MLVAGSEPDVCLAPLPVQVVDSPYRELSRPKLPADGRFTLPMELVPVDHELLRAQQEIRVAWGSFDNVKGGNTYTAEKANFLCRQARRVGLLSEVRWWLAYSMAMWGCQSGEKSGAYGPMDQRWYNGYASSCYNACEPYLEGRKWEDDLLLDWRINMICHAEESKHYSSNRRGDALLRKVFLPSNPHAGITNACSSKWTSAKRQIDEWVEHWYDKQRR